MNGIVQGASGQWYQLGKKISEGGFGDVYLATRLGTNDTIAVKVLRDYRNADALRHFRREVDVLHSLGIIGIIELLDFNLGVEPPFFVMPYMSGGTLLAWAGKLPIANIVSIARWLTNLIAQLHGKNQVHRDIKPDNILVDGTGQLKVADFGLGNDPQFTMAFTGQGAGTAGYAAPEVAQRGQIPNRASDIYSLGATLFHLITGTHPRSAKTLDLAAHNPFTPKALRDLLLEMVHANPAQRPTAQQLVLRLAALNLEAKAEPPPSPPPRQPQSSDSGPNWGAIAGLGLGALALLGLIEAASGGSNPPPRRPPRRR